MSEERDWFHVVAEQKCDECGLTASAVPQGELAGAISDEAGRWAAFLTDHHQLDRLRQRPEPGVWSPLEYAAHVRDVLALFQERVALALVRREPEFGWWDHEAAAVDDGYNEQDPRVVAAALEANATRLGMTLPSPGGPTWQRTGTRRNRERFTVEGLARFALHEARHHRIDAERRGTDGPGRHSATAS